MFATKHQIERQLGHTLDGREKTQQKKIILGTYEERCLFVLRPRKGNTSVFIFGQTKKTASKLRPQCAGDRVPQRWMNIEPGRNTYLLKSDKKSDI